MSVLCSARPSLAQCSRHISFATKLRKRASIPTPPPLPCKHRSPSAKKFRPRPDGQPVRRARRGESRRLNSDDAQKKAEQSARNLAAEFASYEGQPDSLKVEDGPPHPRVAELPVPGLTKPQDVDDHAESLRPKDPPPHVPRVLSYKRRVEGLIQPVESPVLQDVDPSFPQQPVARLAHGLDRVLFNPGVSWLQDPRSRVYNFNPWLEHVPNVKDFAFERIGHFISSSRDQDLVSLAKREGKKFAGSTSSLTGLLSHCYFLIADNIEVDISDLSQHFADESKSFTPAQLMPKSVLFKHIDGVYAIDSTGSETDKNILTWMGTMLEKFLTYPEEQFKRMMRSSDNPLDLTQIPEREAYRYSKSTDFIMRSQLDGQDSRLPGSGIFDIKTRAALPIRVDLMNYEENSGYSIHKLRGTMESFEREYYDLIRSAFLKYSFQARIGNMDGMFIAYHNTARIFGFEYVPLEQMEACLYGAGGRGERVFEKCVTLLEAIAAEVAHHFPAESVGCLVEKALRDPVMRVFVWSEEADSQRPVVQLDVTVTSFINDVEVRGHEAISHIDKPWNLVWSIGTSILSHDEIQENLRAARARQMRQHMLPTHCTLEEMEARWNVIDFGGTGKGKGTPFQRGMWMQAPRHVLKLRELARSGRQPAGLGEDLQKVVYGEPVREDSATDGAASISSPDPFLVSIRAAIRGP